jgi:hypothetical protein
MEEWAGSGRYEVGPRSVSGRVGEKGDNASGIRTSGDGGGEEAKNAHLEKAAGSES